ncbi:DUF6118 family protein [Brevundimonas nasdae]|uniref:DUF6118 family protein n=1 Tax=Brevundimonas nasdae TaxID=172043 RepID=UPI003F6940D4
MREDRWTAGGELMRTGNPPGWSRFVEDTKLVSDNQEAVETCRHTATRTGKDQRCTITVSGPETAPQPQQRRSD